ncbi:hypothetical protein CN918_28300 [Priestia megaterium]|nr:hypothetical protein CN918_28300 [Priestia megaterium]
MSDAQKKEVLKELEQSSNFLDCVLNKPSTDESRIKFIKEYQKQMENLEKKMKTQDVEYDKKRAAHLKIIKEILRDSIGHHEKFND